MFLAERESRLTRSADQIVPLLCDIARTMDRSTRDKVAASDRGCEIDRQLEALDAVLSSETCLLPRDDTWYPAEVVELIFHTRHASSIAPCTALLLANFLQGRHSWGWFEFQSSRRAADYNNLPKSVRAPILAGLRFLFESGGYSPSHPDKNHYDPISSSETLMHVVVLPNDDLSNGSKSRR